VPIGTDTLLSDQDVGGIAFISVAIVDENVASHHEPEGADEQIWRWELKERSEMIIAFQRLFFNKIHHWKQWSIQIRAEFLCHLT
jgi:hypothetical protein